MAKKTKFSVLSAALQDKWMRDLQLISQSNNVTLAQNIGLENRHNEIITKDEWNKIYNTFKLRDDIKYGCSICQEHFKFGEQILLSCSHSFHLNCINSFEKYTNIKCCPICRKKNYKKKIIYDGKIYWRHHNAIIIQKYWYYFKMQKELLLIYQNIDLENLSPNKMTNYCLKKYSVLNSNAIKKVNERSQNIDDFLSMIDNNIKESKKIFNKIKINNIDDNNENNNNSTCNWELKTQNGQTWNEVYDITLKRNDIDCSICLSKLKENNKKLVLLDCTHIFHYNCIQSFERFCLQRHPCCPICRSNYQKMVI